MTTIEKLDGATLKQGDRIDNFSFVFNNRSKLDAAHPLASNGYLTVGYTLRFVAKQNITLADDGTGVINTTLTPTDADNAPLLLLPSDTSGIVFGSNSVIPYVWDFQMSDGADHVYTLESGAFTLERDIALTI